MTKDILIVVGSTEDITILKEAINFLEKIGVAYDVVICHPQLSPNEFFTLGSNAHKQNYKVIIGASSDCPSIAGNFAALTPLPVISVPIVNHHPVGGLDAILTSLQMPEGVPVATVSTNTPQNAALLAIQMLAIAHPAYQEIIIAYKKKLNENILEQNKLLQSNFQNYIL